MQMSTGKGLFPTWTIWNQAADQLHFSDSKQIAFQPVISAKNYAQVCGGRIAGTVNFLPTPGGVDS